MSTKISKILKNSHGPYFSPGLGRFLLQDTVFPVKYCQIYRIIKQETKIEIPEEFTLSEVEGLHEKRM